MLLIKKIDMKILRSSILVLALALSTAACSNNSDSDNDTGEATEMDDHSGNRDDMDGDDHAMDHDKNNTSTGDAQNKNADENSKTARERQKELELSKKEMNRLDSLDAGLELMTTTLTVPQASPVISGYLVLKESLFKGDKAAIKVNAQKVVNQLQDLDDELAEEIRDEALEVSREDEMEEMREEFYELSVHIYQLAKQVNTGVRLYWMHCPTAEFDGHSSSWLSSNQTARNPYFDDDNKACGKVKEVLY